MNLKSSTIHRKTIFEGGYLSVYQDDIRLPTGKETKREIVHAPDGVGVVAIDERDRLILVRQYREAIGREILGIPAGIMDREDATAEATARRELIEETGYEAGDRFELLVSPFYFAEGFCDAKMTIFLTCGARPSEMPFEEDPTEILEIVQMPFEEACRRNDQGGFSDAKTIIALLAAEKRLEKFH